MLITLLVIAGVVLATALAVIAYRNLGKRADNDLVLQRLRIQHAQRLAEARQQRVMQDMVEQLFKAVREDR